MTSEEFPQYRDDGQWPKSRAVRDAVDQHRNATKKLVTSRMERVPVGMPLPPATDSRSISRTQRSGGAKAAFVRKP